MQILQLEKLVHFEMIADMAIFHMHLQYRTKLFWNYIVQ
jgi:hypothetical protein